MASPETLDFERLLAPISDEQPAGAELKEDPALSTLYYQIKDARETARAAERQLQQAAWLGDEISVEPPNWRKVLELASDTLARHSKDLWITAWAIEALARQHGFAGLRDGFRLARELSERYWEAIHPRPDEDGVATTVAQLTGLNGEDSEGALIGPIQNIPITGGTTCGPLTSADYLEAADLQQIADADKRAQRLEQGVASLEMFDQAVRETPPEFFQNLLEDIGQAVEEFARLNEVLEQCCGRDADGDSLAPPSSSIRNALQACGDRVRSLAGHVLQSDPGDGAAEPPEAAAGGLMTVAGERSSGASLVSGQVETREEAFRALLQVADFFRRTEPHSPVSYALQQAVRWGRMPLPELMNELISDHSVRDEMFRRMGIPRPESPED